MLKAILIGGLVVSLFSFFQKGGFQNRFGGSRPRPSTRYGPPGSWTDNNESSTEPYFRIILSSNNNDTIKSTTKYPTTIILSSTLAFENTTVTPGPEIRNKNSTIQPTISTSTLRAITSSKPKSDQISTEISVKNKQEMLVPFNVSIPNSEKTSTVSYEITTIRPLNLSNINDTTGTNPSRTATVTWKSTLILESTSAKPPNGLTTTNKSSIFVQENTTKSLELTTQQTYITKSELSTTTAPRSSTLLLAESTIATVPKIPSPTTVKLSTTTTTAPRSSTLLLAESTIATVPKTTTFKQSSTFAYENITTIVAARPTTSFSILAESTKQNYPIRSSTTNKPPIAQYLFEQTESDKAIVETVTEADYKPNNANIENEFRSRPSNRFIPPPPSYNFSENVTTENHTVDTLVDIPPAYYLPPRIHQFPIV